ncbi:MAG: hypothetical protein JSV56_07545 [Methanomassiliicoccales archaeon]|nr:MAG: hypothetical protein JSV56_07545 [Methanomassiliicoccales archaeon]
MWCCIPGFNTNEHGLCSSRGNRDGVELTYDYIAISFIRSPEEIGEARAFISAEVPHSPKLIVKLETAEAVKEHLDEIIDLVDGVMVARGDLALQVDYAEMGVLQRRIIQKATAAGKEVMVATNVLESVRANRVPNRAEISDITTSVALGASCILLSGETRQGAQPVYTVEVLRRVIEASERGLHQWERE